LNDPICAETPSTSGTGVGVDVGVDKRLDDVDTLDAVALAEADELERLVEDESNELEEDETAPSW